MSDKYTATEQRLLDVQHCINRLYKSDDGKFLMEFFDSLIGQYDFIPKDRLEVAEGARRLIVIKRQAMKLNPKQFLGWCRQKGSDFLS
ncbi:MAG: hypothetical protein KAJ19_05195 [Gammaproteobacteria bacterium]|nr:hypothetical protein [Gammaproteobacteria bacterium]